MVHLSIPSTLLPSTGSQRPSIPGGQDTPRGVDERRTEILMLHFYRPPPGDPLVNRVVAWLDGPYSHVEVGFSDGMASSIFAGDSGLFHRFGPGTSWAFCSALAAQA